MEWLNTIEVKILLISWFVVNFEPVSRIVTMAEFKTPIKLRPIIYVLTCFKCLTFWLTLVITFNIWTALLLSFLASLYDRD